MTDIFPKIPTEAIAFVRRAFAKANKETSRLIVTQPSMHEEGLDFTLVGTLRKVGARILPNSKVGVEIEAHWLGGRGLYHRWEIADIALAILVRVRGRLVARKVALIQTKRLYSKEVPVSEIDLSDYAIGVGRLIDRTDSAVSLSQPRRFSFTKDSVYGGFDPKREQATRIDEYVARRNIPVFYGLYNPLDLPLTSSFPWPAGKEPRQTNKLGCRILPRQDVHIALKKCGGKPPTFDQLKRVVGVSKKPFSDHGWRLENFVADEVLRCREGRIFDVKEHPDLRAMLYERTAPIAAAISVTFDLPEKS